MEKKKEMIYLCLAHMSEEGLEQKYIKEAFDTNWVVPLGPNVDAFERGLEELIGEGKSVVALSSGTAAVHLALLASGVGPGDEVIVQSFTFCASVNPITYVGAVPVFVDSEKDSWNIDLDLLEKAILDRKEKTGRYPKAIVAVALFGMPYDCDRLVAIAEKYGITLIEDSAEGFGSTWKGRMLGTFGRFGVLSFNGNKMITTSGGGALVCPDPETARKVLWYATQARDSYPYYQHSEIGFNYRMSNVCAGIGRGQLTVVKDHLAHHRHVQELYRELLKEVPGVKLHEAPAADYDSNFWLCTATIEPEVKVVGQENAYREVVKGAVGGAAGVTRMVDAPRTDCQPNDNVEALRTYLNDECNIQSRPLWKPMHKQPAFAGCASYENGVSEDIFRRGFCLPAGPWVSDEDVRYIVDSIKTAIIG
ncbi:MAG: aminotransferase class I/II-fold pyridoxal phosphate-dependent enzyme [Bacteroidales bacterium]|nr:aminotransferase class I/II-fold pyridoxal phosphate-dependent enzyme [Bacteroidales bacterium]